MTKSKHWGIIYKWRKVRKRERKKERRRRWCRMRNRPERRYEFLNRRWNSSSLRLLLLLLEFFVFRRTKEEEEEEEKTISYSNFSAFINSKRNNKTKKRLKGGESIEASLWRRWWWWGERQKGRRRRRRRNLLLLGYDDVCQIVLSLRCILSSFSFSLLQLLCEEESSCSLLWSSSFYSSSSSSSSSSSCARASLSLSFPFLPLCVFMDISVFHLCARGPRGCLPWRSVSRMMLLTGCPVSSTGYAWWQRAFSLSLSFFMTLFALVWSASCNHAAG